MVLTSTLQCNKPDFYSKLHLTVSRSMYWHTLHIKSLSLLQLNEWFSLYINAQVTIILCCCLLQSFNMLQKHMMTWQSRLPVTWKIWSPKTKITVCCFQRELFFAQYTYFLSYFQSVVAILPESAVTKGQSCYELFTMNITSGSLSN